MGTSPWESGAVVIGCRENTADFIRKLLQMQRPIAGIVTIARETATRNNVPAWADLQSRFGRDIPVCVASSYSLATEAETSHLFSARADVGFCVGWQRLLPARFLNLYRNGVFGMHASATHLPDGRGRSPINWALIDGADVLNAHIFQYNDQPDTGDLLSVTQVRVATNDDINTLQRKLALTFTDEVNRHWDALVSGTPQLTPLRATATGDRLYPARCAGDGEINWSWSALQITNWVRAQTRPYPGAFTLFENTRYHVWRCIPAGVEDDRPVGSVIATSSDGQRTIGCGEGESVLLLDDDLPSTLADGQRLGA